MTGQTVTRMDADDRMPPQKLERMKKELRASPPRTIVAGKVSYFSESSPVGEGTLRYGDWLNDVCRQQRYWVELYAGCVIPSPCWMMRSQEFSEWGGFFGLTYPEDYDFCFRLHRAGFTVRGIDETLHEWREHETRTSRVDAAYSTEHFLA